jgi:NADPH2:quinone reductase
MRALQFKEFGPVSNLSLADLPNPEATEGTAIVRVSAASINPSDVKNVEGKMENTSLPRVTGRDYSGVVVEGPRDWMGEKVWGTGGEIGYSIDGSHAEFIAVPIASLRRKPFSLSFEQAATVGVPYLTAWLGLAEYAHLSPDETLLVIGAKGGVGGAAAQIGHYLGAQVIGVDRGPLERGGQVDRAVDDYLDTTDGHLEKTVRELTKGLGASVVFDSVGGFMFEPALQSLRHRGRLLEITSTGDRRVSFDLLDFYHQEVQLFGVDSRARDSIASAVLLESLRPGFELGGFQAPAIDKVFALSDGIEAFGKVARGEVRGRLVLVP